MGQGTDSELQIDDQMDERSSKMLTRSNRRPIKFGLRERASERASNFIPNTGRREGSEEAKKGKTR